MATTRAVIVALGLGVYPIVKDRRERKADTESLCEQLSALLYPLMMGCQKYLGRGVSKREIEGRTVTIGPLYAPKAEDRACLDELRALYPSLTRLKTKEEESMRLLYFRDGGDTGRFGADGKPKA